MYAGSIHVCYVGLRCTNPALCRNALPQKRLELGTRQRGLPSFSVSQSRLALFQLERHRSSISGSKPEHLLLLAHHVKTTTFWKGVWMQKACKPATAPYRRFEPLLAQQTTYGSVRRSVYSAKALSQES
nr:hypothetical protein CFP56_52826 [Quercus suber]